MPGGDMRMIPPPASIVSTIRHPALVTVAALVATLAQSAAVAALAQSTAVPDPPDPAGQQRVLRAVTDFARGYIERLPDFTCTRRAEHFQSKTGQEWQLQVKVAEELSYYRRAEHYKIVEVNGAPAKKVPFAVMAAGYYSSGGNFGQLLGELFDPKAQAQFQWKGWEELRGRQAYVFSYRVPLESSETRTGRCTSWVLFQRCNSVKFGYHGLLYVDRDAPRVMRITQVADDVPASYPAGADSVDYDPVTVAGVEYLLPVADESQSQFHKTMFRNRSTYGDYRKFVAESTMTTADLPPESGTPRKPAVETGDAAPVAGHCFDLRDRTARGEASHLTAGALAAAFNDPRRAEAELQAAIRTAAAPEDAAMARSLLAAMYARAGQGRQALAQIDEIAAHPATGEADGGDELRDARARIAALAQFPEQTVAARGLSRLRYSKQDDKLAVPLQVNGKAARFALDTGAAISVVGESAARALGMDLRGDRLEMNDAAGQRLPCRAALAAQMTVGRFQFRNVAFCALPDDQPGFADVPEMERGLIGLPVLLAFGAISWTDDGVLEIGGPSARRDLAKSNLCMDGALPVVEAAVGGHRLGLALDTGNPATFLFREFGEDFPDALKGATPVGQYEMQGLGESVTLESRSLPRLDLRVAGHSISLESVAMLMQPASAGCLGCWGNAGLDLFARARRVKLDFQAMRLTLEP
jgi:hypothetical protein